MRLKVLFCGQDHFKAAFKYTSEAVNAMVAAEIPTAHVEVTQTGNDDRNELLHRLSDADVVVPLMTRLGHEEIIAAKTAKLIMQFGTGIEGVDINAATQAGISVAKIPSDLCDNASSCAEHIIYLTMALMRDQKGMAESLEQRLLGQPIGKTISGSEFLIYGYGGIASKLIPKLAALGATVNVVATSPERVTIGGANHVERTNAFEKLAGSADVVAMCCSQNKHNLGLVDERFIAAMKHGSLLVNVARGGLLNYRDVRIALDCGHLGGVGLDVYSAEPFPTTSDELWRHRRCVATPHIAGVSEHSYRQMARILAENVLRVAKSEPLQFVVNA